MGRKFILLSKGKGKCEVWRGVVWCWDADAESQ
jgi:hypothetical protein